jgi:hypothetical protein
MATFNRANDGHLFIRKGYPLTFAGVEEMQYATYQVYGRAEAIFDTAGFRDGQQIPKELFYALIVEGDITNDFFTRHPPTIWCVPCAIRNQAAVFESHDQVGPLLGSVFRDARYVIDFYRILNREPHFVPSEGLIDASLLSLARHLRQYAHDREVERRFPSNQST